MSSRIRRVNSLMVIRCAMLMLLGVVNMVHAISVSDMNGTEQGCGTAAWTELYPNSALNVSILA